MFHTRVVLLCAPRAVCPVDDVGGSLRAVCRRHLTLVLPAAGVIT